LASSIWSGISSTVSSLVSQSVQFLQDQWGRLAGFAQNAWQNVSSVFSSAWGTYIAGPLNSLEAQVSGWFSNMAGQALQWGANIINSLAQGIEGAAGAVGNAASDVAGKIASLLGFHSPAKEGPASDADKWMPNLINMLSSGLISNTPQLGLAATIAAQALATPLATGFRADPSTRADQLSFSTPSLIYSGAGKPKETSAERKAEEERKREERKREEEKKKEERKREEAEKKRVHADIQQIKVELHIHHPNSRLTKQEIDEICQQAAHQFGKQIGDEIRAQFGNV
jgi:phage-related protein